MELRHLTALKAIAMCGTFVRASEFLHVSQPSLTAQIQQLEEEVGVSLVFRGSGIDTALTPLGRRFLDHAIRALDELSTGIQEISTPNAKHDFSGTIKASVLPSIMASWLPEILLSFLRRYPNIEVSLEEDGTDMIYRKLESGDSTIGLTSDEGRARYSCIKLLTESFVAIVPMEMISGSAPRLVADLSNLPFILYKPGYIARTIVLAACSRSGFVPKVAFESGRLTTIISLVKLGAGCSLIPYSTVSLSGFKTIMPFMLDDAPARTISVVWPQNHMITPAEDAFITTIRDSIVSWPLASP